MDKAHTAPFKAQLLALQTDLRSQLTTLRGGDVGRVEASAAHFEPTQDARGQVAAERALELTLDEHESAELRAVQAALQRIENGTYGLCSDCGVAIAPARLHAAPQAERCIGCQEAFERAR